MTYDGLDVMLDQNSDGSQVTYLNGLGIDNKLRQTVNGQAQYFLNDHLGSTNALTDATGNVIASTNYDSFGNATNANLGTRYQFTGREYDELTGLHYYRNRWYSAELGRFISEDPIGFAGGDANLYGYVWNNPSNATDSLGLSQDGPVNYLRDPFPPEYWGGNALSNTVSDLLGLDWVAQWGWTIGDHRCSFEDRVGAGAKLVGWGAFQAFGGAIVGKAISKIPWAKALYLINKYPKFSGLSQVRNSGAVHHLVDPNNIIPLNQTRLIVSESHPENITKLFKTYDGELNLLRKEFWRDVLPHRHVYDLPTAPTNLNANWRKTFEKLGASKTTSFWWEGLP